MGNPKDICFACEAVRKLGLDDQQGEIFHELVNIELDLAAKLHEMEEAGVDVEGQGIEDTVLDVVERVLEANNKHTLN